MEWWLVLLIVFGSLVVLLVSGLPVAFVFLIIDLAGGFLIFGGQAGLVQVITNVADTMIKFTLLPIALFVFMGEVLFESGMGLRIVESVARWLGRLPGRLGVLAIATGTLFATMSGSNMASTAMLGSILVPEMEKRGYKKTLSLGPCMAGGALAMLIPPSTLGVLLAVIAKVSVGALLIAGIIPALILACLYVIYIAVRAYLQPSIAPAYDVEAGSFSERVGDTVRYLLPCGTIIFLVIGVILLGIATPSEAAALGSVGIMLLAAAYRRMNWGVIKKSTLASTRTSVMIFMIILGSTTFSQILSFSGATAGMVNAVTGFHLSPIMLVIAMQLVLIFLGCFIDNLSMVMIAMPVYLPLIKAAGIDPLWFAVLVLINMDMATLTPPFGLVLFTMKAVAPPDTTMGDIYHSVIPFVICQGVVMAIIMLVPSVALWLPSVMR